jgi:hypothetical protein
MVPCPLPGSLRLIPIPQAAAHRAFDGMSAGGDDRTDVAVMGAGCQTLIARHCRPRWHPWRRAFVGFEHVSYLKDRKGHHARRSPRSKTRFETRSISEIFGVSCKIYNGAALGSACACQGREVELTFRPE